MTFPPDGLDQIIATFGDPRPFVSDHKGWESKVLRTFLLPYQLRFGGIPVSKIRAHAKAGQYFIAAFKTIEDEGLTDFATEYEGIYAFRCQRDSDIISTHTWGIAIDLNASKNPLGGASTQDPRIVDIFKQQGFMWGGDFQHRKDPMHFQLATGY